LSEEVESRFADLPVEVAGVGLAECFGVFGEQADEEVDAAEVAVRQAFSHDLTSGSSSTWYMPVIHSTVYASHGIGQGE
jgi:hypothetical protein